MPNAAPRFAYLTDRLARSMALAAGAVLLAHAGCSTPKEAASDAMGPEVTIHSIPEGAEVALAGKSLGKAPVIVSVHRADKAFDLGVKRDHYFGAQTSVDAAALYAAGGGELWIALKPSSMGEASGPLTPDSATDVDRAGVSTGKAGHCEDALQFFTRALVLEPSLVRVYRDRAHCLFKLHRRDDAIASLGQYVILAPDASDVDKVNAQIAKARGNQDIEVPSETVTEP